MPRDRPPVPPPERIHTHSYISPSGIPGEVYVVEWTGSEISRHRVTLDVRDH